MNRVNLESQKEHHAKETRAAVCRRAPDTAPDHDIRATTPAARVGSEEAEAFLSFANAESADWFTSATVPLLAQLARHIVQARRVAELIERNVGQKDTELGYYVELLKQQRAESQAIATLATKLRLTPQSRRTDRGNARPPEGHRPPWEI